MRYVGGTEVGLRGAQETVARKLGFVSKSKDRDAPKGSKTVSKTKGTPSIRSSVG